MINPADIVIRLVLGAALGGIIGFERHTHGRPAGFRTHLLVCVASVLVMIVSEYYHLLGVMDPSYISVDPARVAAGAITGVGFLGAGVIVKSGVNVHGLTTAACLWIVSAIGLAVGSGLYLAAVVSFIITYLALWTLRKVEARISRLAYKFITVIEGGEGSEGVFRSALEKHGTRIENVDYDRDVNNNESTYHITIAFKGEISLKKILDDLSSLPTVKRVTIRNQ